MLKIDISSIITVLKLFNHASSIQCFAIFKNSTLRPWIQVLNNAVIMALSGLLSQVENYIDIIDLLHKSHNALVSYPTIYHFVTEMCTYVHISVTKWCIVVYLSDALWDLWDWSIGGNKIKPRYIFLCSHTALNTSQIPMYLHISAHNKSSMKMPGHPSKQINGKHISRFHPNKYVSYISNTDNSISIQKRQASMKRLKCP